jgi:uncharacterized damage-inducible protein DinB
MDWTAPKVTRVEPPNTGGERESLEGWLEYHRQTLLFKCAGLNAEQLRARSAPPSSLSLLGLLRHMTDVERAWFRRRVAGEQVEYQHSRDDSPDADFDEVDDADPEADFAAFIQETELARKAAAGRPLDFTFIHPRTKEELSLRWVYLHMIEEYARHNGHADLLRERIDGVTGD